RSVPIAEVIEQVGVARAIQIKHVASVLYTYRCTLRCRHCLFNCAPDRPNVHVSLEDGLDFLRQLHATGRCIHIAGGEALMYYHEVLELCREADREGIAPHFIETNATWCVNGDVARKRLLELQDAGVQGLLISACPHHQHECPPERFRTCYETAVEVFGDRNVASSDVPMETLRNYHEIAMDDEKLGEYVRLNNPCLVGRAGERLARYLPERPIDDLAHDSMWKGASEDASCRKEFDGHDMWEIHIDPYGNYQTCCGIIFGNTKNESLAEVLERGVHTANPLTAAVHAKGPMGLLEIAVEKGYQPREGYQQKCGMCWEIRKFLRPFYPDILGPAEIYQGD
ncbi:MAG TPA: radical SAM protein, partial [Armatimonadota bacterium]|nr:radical SAM protein [Armatimonadota bacterium]